MTSRLTDVTFYEYIVDLLERRPELRDSDNHLIAVVWYQEAKRKGLELKDVPAFTFLRMVRDGEFTTTESIQRARRKAQEQRVDLRGTHYRGRQVKEQEVRDHFREA